MFSHRFLRILVQLSLAGALAVLLGAFYLGFLGNEFSRKCFPDGLHSAGLAMELVHSAKDVPRIIPCPADRVVLGGLQKMDFIFIASYASLYVSLSLLLMRRKIPGAFILGAVAVCLSILAAVFDVREDFAILNLLAMSDPLKETATSAIRHPSLIKWTLLFVATILVSLVFFPRRDFRVAAGKLFTAIGVLLVTSGIVGLFGLLFHRLIPAAMLLSILATLLTCFALWLAPDAFLDGGHFRIAD